MGRRGSEPVGAAALARGSGLPAGTFAQPSRSRSVQSGPWPDARHPRLFHVGGTGDLIDPLLFPHRLARYRARLPGGEENFPLRRLLGIPVSTVPDNAAPMIFDGGLGEGSPPLAKIGVSSKGRCGCHRGCVIMEAASTLSGSPNRKLSATGRLRPERTCGAKFRSRRIPTEDVGLDHHPVRPGVSSCSPRTTLTSRAGAAHMERFESLPCEGSTKTAATVRYANFGRT